MASINQEYCSVVNSTGERCAKLAAPGRKMCHAHRSRQSKTGDVQADVPIAFWGIGTGRTCFVVDSTGERCGRPVEATGKMCPAHKHRQHRTGDVRADIPIRPIAPPGNGTVDDRGYKRIYVNGKTRAEHRVVMEEILGRSLLPGENVHHKNGDKLDNCPENLELWCVSQPYGQRVQDLIEYIAKYHADAMLEALGRQNDSQ